MTLGLCVAIGLLAGAGDVLGGVLGLNAAAAAMLASAPWLAGFWFSAWGVGRCHAGLRRRGPGQVLAVGAAAVLLAGWLVAWGPGISRALVLAVLAPGWVLGGVDALRVWRLSERRGRGLVRPERRRLGPGPLLLLPGLALLVVAASVPPGAVWRVEAFGYDALSYHLQIPREWLAAGRMVELEHSVYAYLPGLLESGFALLMAALGVDPAAGPTSPARAASAAVAAQWFHASFAGVAALCVREALGHRGLAGWAAAGVFLAVPWVMVTGSSAYNEMAALCFGAAALALVATPGVGRSALRPALRGAWVGGLLGAACLAKPTAGFLLALPLGGWMLAQALLDPRHRPSAAPRTVAGFLAKRRRSAALAGVAVAVLVGLAVLGPWWLRNAIWTGNPVFPFATGSFGSAHWGGPEVAAWSAAHAAPTDASPGELWRQWLGNRGFGALGGTAAESSATEIAVFAREGGLPTLWLFAAAGAALGLVARRTRALSIGLVGLLGFQLASWWFLTHHQSRFLVFTVLPGALAVGVLVRAVGSRSGGGGAGGGAGGGLFAARGRAAFAAVVPVAVLALVSASVLWNQTRRLPAAEPGAPAEVLAPWAWMWAWTEAFAPRSEPSATGAISASEATGLDAHPLDTLPAGSRVLVVGDNGGLFYADADFAYASAFDAHPLVPMLERAEERPDRPDALGAELRASGFTHLWIGWSELARLQATYGLDPRLRVETLNAATRDLPGTRTPTWALLQTTERPAASK